MSKGLRRIHCVSMWICAALLVLMVSASRVQAQAETATISGTATDPSGAALVGAKVSAANVGTGASQGTVTDSGGRYKISPLAVGTYDVQTSLSGFQTVLHTGVVLGVGSSVLVDFSLPVGNVTETVKVETNV